MTTVLGIVALDDCMLMLIFTDSLNVTCEDFIVHFDVPNLMQVLLGVSYGSQAIFAAVHVGDRKLMLLDKLPDALVVPVAALVGPFKYCKTPLMHYLFCAGLEDIEELTKQFPVADDFVLRFLTSFPIDMHKWSSARTWNGGP